jgi:hypothetical protein
MFKLKGCQEQGLRAIQLSNKIILGSLISLSKFIGGVAAAVPQYIFLNIHMKGGSHRSI